jgi:hypothetical protein
MEKIFFSIVALIFTIQLIRRPGVKKLPWFFAGILFFPAGIIIIDTPSMPFPRLMIYVLLIVTIVKEKQFLPLFKIFPLKVPLIILFVLLLFVGLFDSRLDYFLKFYRPVTYFLENFFIVFLTFLYIKDVKDGLYIYNYLIMIFFFFTLYGISNYFTRQNEYNALISNVYDTVDFSNNNMIAGLARFRVSSFAFHAIFYGLLLNLIILLEMFVFTSTEIKPKKKKIIYVIIAFLLIVNLFLVNSRTPLFSLVAGAIIYILFAVKFTKKVAMTVAIILGGIITVAILPKSQQIIDKSVYMILGRSTQQKEDGSSIQMRQQQLDASINVFNRSPIFGNGFEYINENLGYKNERSQRSSANAFAGFESYSFKLLIEQGLCGIIGNIIFFLTAIIWLIKKYFKVSLFGRKAVVFTGAIITSFLIFILGTGDLGSFLFFMALLGVNLKLIVISDDKDAIYYSSNARNLKRSVVPRNE